MMTISAMGRWALIFFAAGILRPETRGLAEERSSMDRAMMKGLQACETTGTLGSLQIAYRVSGGPPPGASRRLRLFERAAAPVLQVVTEGLDSGHAHYVIETFELAAAKQDVQSLVKLLLDKSVMSAPLSESEQAKEKDLIIDGALWTVAVSHGKNHAERRFLNDPPAFFKPFSEKAETLIEKVEKEGAPISHEQKW